MDIAKLVRIPFPRRDINPETTSVRPATMAWLTDLGLLSPPAAVQEYDAMRLDLLPELPIRTIAGAGFVWPVTSWAGSLFSLTSSMASSGPIRSRSGG